jgi:hypothetical protein
MHKKSSLRIDGFKFKDAASMEVFLSFIISRHKIRVKFSLNGDFIRSTLTWGQMKGGIAVKLSKKTMLQVVLLLSSVAMIGFGAWRGEADTVLSKAIRLCLECVGIG